MNPTNLFNKKIGGVVLTLSLILSFALSKAATPASADDAKVAAIVAKMTLEQKARLVVGTGMHFIVPDSIKAKLPPGFGGPFDPTDPAYSAITEKIQQYLPGAAGVTIEYPALGIASQVLTDGPAGVRIQPVRPGATQTYYCTAFPIATLLASSWDQELVRNVGVAMGNEVKEYGSDVILGPALNIQRDPLCGRNFEYYSEDPLVAGKMAAAMVKGIQSNGVGTSIKHFAANNSETNRMSVNTIVSQRALREIYLRGFEIVVKEAQPWTVMSSYNKLNGVYTSESPDLLTKVLREDWGFKGYVMTDWGGGSDAVAQMIAGNDLLMPGQPGQTKAIMAAVKSGKMSEKLLNRNVSKILKVMLMAPRYNQYKFSNTPDLKSHAMVTREAASNGMVLLKNNTGSLPLSTSIHNIAAFGNTSYEFISGGTGSGDVNEAYTVSLTEGLKNGGYQVQSALQDRYLKYIADTRASNPPSKNPFAAMMGSKEPVAEMKVPVALAEEMAAANDVALITIGRNAGEGYDRTATEGDFYLTPTEKEMIKHVCDAFHAKGKKAIVIINSGGVIETASWRDLPDAILLAWQGGQEGGNSVTDILSGKVNPSGKLAVTFPISYQDCPSAKNFPGVEIKSDKQDNSADLSGFSFMRKTPWQITYEEDIFVGYRYFTTFQKPVAYEFGYGLSYTTYNYSNLVLSAKEFGEKFTASVTVKNSGKVAGREVVQLYLTAPSGKLVKPAQTLAAFAKTKLLRAGESQIVTFQLEPRDLASFDEEKSGWVADAGNYVVKVGASSANLPLTATFSLPASLSCGTVNRALAPTAPFAKMTDK